MSKQVPLSSSHLVILSARLRTTLPYWVLGFGILSVSMAAILVRWANAPATVMGFWRMVIAAGVLAFPFARATRHHIPARSSILLAGVAGLLFSLNLATWNSAAQITHAANVTLLGNTSVILVPLTAMLVFKRRLRSGFWLGVVLAVIGVATILAQDLIAHPALGIGDSLALVSAFFYTFYLLTMERVRARLATLAAWWCSTVASAISLGVMSFVFRQPLFGYPIASFIVFATMALLVQIGGFMSLNYAQGHLPAPLVATTLLLQPVLTAILAVPLLGQSLGVVQIIGGAMVLTGIVIAHRSRN